MMDLFKSAVVSRELFMVHFELGAKWKEIIDHYSQSLFSGPIKLSCNVQKSMYQSIGELLKLIEAIM